VRTGIWRGDLRERDLREDLAIDGWIILKWMLKTWDGGMDWIDLTQVRDKWRAVVNAVTNLPIHKTRNFWTS
jgi:hypothetical protein